MNVQQSFSSGLSKPNYGSFITTWLKKRIWFSIFVILPTLMAIAYFGLFASDIYTSESRFVIKSPEEKHAQLSTLANLIQTTGISGGQEQANEVLDYVRSRDALQALQRDIDIRNRYTSRSTDWVAGFPHLFGGRKFEDLYKYYGRMVSARLDTETGTAIVTTKAFTADDAFLINRDLLRLSEALVNQLNIRAQGRAIAESERQVQLATLRARQARVALAQYRNSRELIDPGKQAVGVIDIANGMIAQRAALQAQLDATARATPHNPSIPALRAKIAAISAQISSQDSRVVGAGSGIASKMGGYENLFVEQEFATQSLNAANAALVQSRAEAQRQQFYLERVVDPNLPDKPLLPRRLLSIVAVAATATCLYFVGWMLVVGILEHSPED